MKLRFFHYRLCIYLINWLIAGNLRAQEPVGPPASGLARPVDIPIFLSGNFGEPRANHFHSGIDIKTNGVTGIPVKSIAAGHVSRIKVEPGGFGKAVYISHPGGYTSVYAHLQSFNNKLAEYVESEQYRRESFTVDLFPESRLFPVNSGEVIALSGNSGSSEGPHLHFEIRDTRSENPVNPLVRSLPLTDRTPPVMERLVIYSLGRHKEWIKPVTAILQGGGGTYTPRESIPLPLDHQAGIGISLYDLVDGSANRCGVYRLQGYLDDELFFESLMDEFSFAETRYMNSYMDYRIHRGERRYVLKLFVEPNNRAGIYRYSRNNGVLEVTDNRVHQLRIVAEDAAGNRSVATCRIRLNPAGFQKDPAYLPTYEAFFSYAGSNRFSGDGFEIELPQGALYDDVYFQYSTEPAPAGSYSPVHRVHRSETPLHQFCRVLIRPAGLPERLKAKALIVQRGDNGRFTSLGGSWEGDRLAARVRSFGDYSVQVDTIPPVVRPANFSLGSDLKTLKVFKFIISDNLSGISRYRGELDGRWILLEYDQKNRLLEYSWDSGRVEKGKLHRLVIRVSDQVGNTSTVSYEFER
ncbi:MAG: M23 family metallopeptidase [Bacteroidales bacterium]